MVDLIGLLPFLGIAAVGGGIILLINNKEQICAFLKEWWKNRNEKQTS